MSCAYPLRAGHFNPLRREGGDHHQYGKTHGIHDFNPLRREGGDLCPGRFQLCRFIISIHSAARAETHRASLRMWRDCYFNPLRREGGDPFGLHPAY